MTGKPGPDITQTTTLPGWTDVRENAGLITLKIDNGRIEETEARLEAGVKELLRQAAETDEAEDAECGPQARGDELPEELRRRERRLSLRSGTLSRPDPSRLSLTKIEIVSPASCHPAPQNLWPDF